MFQLSDSDRRELQSVTANALVGDSGEALIAEAVALDADGIKDFFCRNWPMMKQVLQFIGDTVGGIVRAAIRGVIAAGDFLHDRICPR
ncbi:MAG: hypothetical protein JO276_15320 [Sphingomonadaceae bacterium]|nr:hypothetical protein [Sphingomonadaceae bacterium]